jgi:hypothetical protein
MTDDRVNEGTFTFTDRLGTVWDVTVTLAGAMRIDKSDFSELTDVKFSFLNPGKEFFTSIMSQDPLIFAMIWAVVQPQAKREGILTEDAFVERLNGQAILDGRKAWWKAVADFFPGQKTELLRLMSLLPMAQERLQEELRIVNDEAESLMQEMTEVEAIKLRQSLRVLIQEERQALKKSKEELGEKSGECPATSTTNPEKP